MVFRFGALALAFTFLNALFAQSLDAPLLDNLKWRLIGPFRGGRSVAVSGVQGSGTTFYFGAVNGGIWKSTNAGTTWRPIFDKQSVASIGALVVAPSDPNIIYAGTGESDIRSNLSTGDGIYKSTDAGISWHNIGLEDSRQISRIAVDSTNPNHVVVAALGHAYAPNDTRGIFVSFDGGTTWKKSLFTSSTVGAADVAIAPDNPEIVVAALWEAHRPPYSVYPPSTGPGSSLYVSKNSGNSFSLISGHGLPTANIGRIGVAIAAHTNGRRMYASVEASKDDSGLYRSDDAGDTWHRVNSDPRLTSRAWYFSCLTVDPNDPDIVYMPNIAVYKLTNGGEKLSVLRGAPGGDDYHQLWIDPANSSRMALASDQGTIVSIDGGDSWTTWYNQPTAQLYHVITDNAYPYVVYASQQDSGSVSVPSRTDHGEIDNSDMSNVGGGESGYVAVHPTDPNVFFISGGYGTLDRFDRRTHVSQNIAPSVAMPSLADPSKRKYRDPWTPVLVFSPIQKNALYFGTQYVMRTLDEGKHWQTISPDLTGTVAQPAGYGVVYSIAPSPLVANQVWAGTDTGLVHLTRNAGVTWSNVTPPDLTPWSKISQIEASHFSSGEAFLAVDRHRVDDMSPHAYRTRDFGKTWQSITNGFANNAFLRVIREDPKHQGLLYAGTEFGIYVSFDDGDHWQSLQRNLPVTSVTDLVIHDKDLVIATHGRSFWIMDDITPLRQMSGVSLNTTKLFAPSQAVRTISDSFLGTPLPLDEAQAENPAGGATIDYILGPDSQGPVTLEFVSNATGEVVRRYASTDKPAAPPTDLPIAPRWFHPTPVLSAAPGIHRFNWDLRYKESGNGNPDDEDDIAGPFIIPGSYTVRLTTADGKHYTQPLRVIPDPRSAATPTDWQQQFVWAKLAYQGIISVRQGKDPKLKETVAALNSALRAIESSDRAPTSQAMQLVQSIK